MTLAALSKQVVGGVSRECVSGDRNGKHRQGFGNAESVRIQNSMNARLADLCRGLDKDRKATDAQKALAARRIQSSVGAYYDERVNDG